MSTTVRSVERLSASFIRIVTGGPDLARFAARPDTDSYVKVVFGHPDADYPRPLDLDAIRESFPAEQWPRLRTYTVRNWDPAAQELTLDFVVHGDAGLAGPWAAAAKPGDELFLIGPGGGYEPDLAADWHLFVGDESALPAISVALERLPADARALAFIEVHDATDEIKLTTPAETVVTWLHRGDGAIGDELVRAVSAATFPDGTVHAFVHGEAGFVKRLRQHLRVDRGLAREQLSISGYWRVGADDEGWRASKAEWNREVEAVEVAAGLS